MYNIVIYLYKGDSILYEQTPTLSLARIYLYRLLNRLNSNDFNFIDHFDKLIPTNNITSVVIETRKKDDNAH